MKSTAFRAHVRSGSRTCLQLAPSNSQLNTRSPRPQLANFSIRPPIVTETMAPMDAVVSVKSSQGPALTRAGIGGSSSTRTIPVDDPFTVLDDSSLPPGEMSVVLGSPRRPCSTGPKLAQTSLTGSFERLVCCRGA